MHTNFALFVAFLALTAFLPVQGQDVSVDKNNQSQPSSEKHLTGRIRQNESNVRVGRPQVPQSHAGESLKKARCVDLDSEVFDLSAVEMQAQNRTKEILSKTDGLSSLFEIRGPSYRPQGSVLLKPYVERSQGAGKIDQGSDPDTKTLRGKLQLLSKHDVVVLLDRSGSMATPDCDGLTRWDWCKRETENFSGITRQALPDGFNLFLFALGYEDEGMRTLDNLSEVFQKHNPGGATVLSTAIAHCFERYLTGKSVGSQKPLVIAVITDGLPQDYDQVRQQIIKMTHRIHDFNEVKLTFLRVGTATEGDKFIRDLDDNLVAKGAEYDIVDSMDFGELKDIGLLDAFIQAITERKSRFE